eukprot:PhF_6_TR17063/c0_g1_i3/m.26113
MSLALPGTLNLSIEKASNLEFSPGSSMKGAAPPEVCVDVLRDQNLIRTLPNRLDLVNPSWEGDDALSKIPLKKGYSTEITIKLVLVKAGTRSLIGMVTIDPASYGNVGTMELPLMDISMRNKIGGTVTVRWKYISDESLKQVNVKPLAYPGYLSLTIIGGKDMINLDGDYDGDLSDPYVVVERKGTRLFNTPFIKDTLNPRWDPSQATAVVRIDTEKDTPLDLLVYDKEDLGSDDFMGQYLGFDFKNIGEKGSTVLALQQRPNEKDKAILNAKGKLGLLKVSWQYTPGNTKPSPPGGNQTPATTTTSHPTSSAPTAPPPTTTQTDPSTVTYPIKYTFTVVRCKGLLDRDGGFGGKSDPYVEMFFKGSKVLETPVIDDNEDPEWKAPDATATVTVQSIQDAVVQFMVWDKDPVGQDFLGMLTLDLKNIHSDGTKEFPLVPRPQEQDQDILTAKGKLGTITLNWKYSGSAVSHAAKHQTSPSPTTPAPLPNQQPNTNTNTAPPLAAAGPPTGKCALTVANGKNLLHHEGRYNVVVQTYFDGSKIHETPYASNTVSPTWAPGTSTAIINVQPEKPWVQYMVFGKVENGKDLFLGMLNLNLQTLPKPQGSGEFPLIPRPQETEADVVAAKGNLGSLVIQWGPPLSTPQPQPSSSTAPRINRVYPTKFTLTCIQGNLLLDRDLGGLSDPYVEFFQHGKKVFETNVKDGTLNPQWAYSEGTATLTVNTPEDALIQVMVWDKDAFSSDFLGQFVIDLAHEEDHGKKEFKLLPRNNETEKEVLAAQGKLGTLTLEWKCTGIGTKATHGSPHINLPATPTDMSKSMQSSFTSAVGSPLTPRYPARYTISIERCNKLIDRDTGGGTSDPFVQIFQNGQNVFQTNVKDDTSTPTWQYTEGTATIVVKDEASSVLRFVVWDKDPIGQDFLGMCLMDLKGLSSDGRREIKLEPRPNETDKEVLQAKGNLGSIVVSWKHSGDARAGNIQHHQKLRKLTFPLMMNVYVSGARDLFIQHEQSKIFAQLLINSNRILETPPSSGKNPKWGQGCATSTVLKREDDEKMTLYALERNGVGEVSILGQADINLAAYPDEVVLEVPLHPHSKETNPAILARKDPLGFLQVGWMLSSNLHDPAQGPKRVPGILKVQVLSARDLICRDLHRPPNAWVSLSHNSKQVNTTSVIPNNTNPAWSDPEMTVQFSPIETNLTTVLTVFDRDALGSEFLGEAVLDVTKLDGSGGVITLPLHARDNEKDHVILQNARNLGHLIVQWQYMVIPDPSSTGSLFSLPISVTFSILEVTKVSPELLRTHLSASIRYLGKSVFKTGTAEEGKWSNCRRSFNTPSTNEGGNPTLFEFTLHSRSGWEAEETVGVASIDMQKVDALNSKKEIPLMSSDGSHRTIGFLSISWNILQQERNKGGGGGGSLIKSPSKAFSETDLNESLVIRVHRCMNLIAPGGQQPAPAVFIRDHDGHEVMKTRHHNVPTTNPSWADDDTTTTCEIPISGSSPITIEVFSMTDGKFLGRAELVPQKMSNIGSHNVPLKSRGSNETDPDVLRSQEKLGHVSITWKKVPKTVQFADESEAKGSAPGLLRLSIVKATIDPSAYLNTNIRFGIKTAQDRKYIFTTPAKSSKTAVWAHPEATTEVSIKKSESVSLELIRDGRESQVLSVTEFFTKDLGPSGSTTLFLKGEVQGTVDVKWEFQSQSRASPKSSELRLEVKEIKGLGSMSTPVFVEVTAVRKTEKTRSVQPESGRLFLGSLLTFPATTPSMKISFKVMTGERVIGEGTVDASANNAHNETVDTIVPIKGGTQQRELCSVIIRYKYDFAPQTSLHLMVDTNLAPQRGVLVFEVSEMLKVNGLLSLRFGLSNVSISKQSIGQLNKLGMTTPTGVLHITGKGTYGKLEIDKTQGEGWIELTPSGGEVYLRWKVFYNRESTPPIMGGDIEFEVRCGRNLPDDVPVSIAIMPDTMDKKLKKAMTTRSTNKDVDVEWGNDGKFALPDCSVVQVALQRTKDGMVLAQHKVHLPPEDMSWEGWISFKRGIPLGDVYVRWIRLTSKSPMKRKPSTPQDRKKPSLMDDDVFVTIVNGAVPVETLPMSRNAIIQDLKPIFEQYTSIPENQQLLYVSTKPSSALSSSKTLGDYVSESQSACKIIVRSSKGNITLRVGLPSGKTVYVTVQEQEPSRAIKEALIEEKVSKGPLKKMRLLHAGQEIAEDMPVSYYRLKPMANLELAMIGDSTTSMKKHSNDPYVSGSHKRPHRRRNSSDYEDEEADEDDDFLRRDSEEDDRKHSGKHRNADGKRHTTNKQDDYLKEPTRPSARKVTTNTSYTGELVVVDLNGTEHRLANVDFLQPLSSLRKKIPNTSKGVIMYAGKIVDSEFNSVLSLEPEALEMSRSHDETRSAKSIAFHKIYFVPNPSRPDADATKADESFQMPNPFNPMWSQYTVPPPPPQFGTSFHPAASSPTHDFYRQLNPLNHIDSKEKEISDLQMKLKEATLRAEAAEDKARKQQRRIEDLERALQRSHGFLERVLQNDSTGPVYSTTY